MRSWSCSGGKCLIFLYQKQGKNNSVLKVWNAAGYCVHRMRYRGSKQRQPRYQHLPSFNLLLVEIQQVNIHSFLTDLRVNVVGDVAA